MKIDIQKLVDEIHAAEAAYRSGKWAEFCEPRGLGRSFGSGGRFWPTDYAETVTGLYTLRAWNRGKCHRQNPPENVRGFNRTMEEEGRSERMSWDMTDHNQKIAEALAPKFARSEAQISSDGYEAAVTL